MSNDSSSLNATLRWLADHAGFPARRLPAKAELLVCVAAAAEESERLERGTGGEYRIQSRDNALESSQRALAMRRTRVHFKCDNSAKV